jgi:hypothetical protein
MRNLDSRAYTNMALTVLILLLTVLVARPYLQPARAYAAPVAPGTDAGQNALLNPYVDVAAAIREVADSNRQVAAAVQETAKAQRDVARAIERLASGASAH